MSRMLCKLAFRNVRKSIGDYAVYFLTLTFGIIVFYTFNSIDAQQAMMDLSASQNMNAQLTVAVMGYLSVFISFVLGFLILYANNFLIRRRKKELGIYMSLGMSKSKVSFVFIMETLLVGLFSLALGLLLGVLVSQGMSFLTAKLFEVNLQAYRFVFSPAALIKTVLYFGVIFLFVMAFNVFSISRHKLIDLIHASKQAERPRVRSLGLSLTLVVLGCACIGYAYYQVLSLGLLLSFASGLLAVELLLGCVGTVLLFTGGSGIALRLSGRNPRRYYKKLNLFVSRQLTSKINSTHTSMSVISLMLFFTIVIFTLSTGLSSALNRNLENTTLYDISFTQMPHHDEDGNATPWPDGLNDFNLPLMETFRKAGINPDDYFSGSCTVRYFTTDYDVRDAMLAYFPSSMRQEYETYTMDHSLPVSAISVSDLNEALILAGRSPIALQADEYALISTNGALMDGMQQFLDDQNTVTLHDKTYRVGHSKLLNFTPQTTSFIGEAPVLVVPDTALTGLAPDYQTVSAQYRSANKQQTEDALYQALDQAYADENGPYQGHWPYTHSSTRLQLRSSSVSLKVTATFIGLYLGIVFLISCAAILALQQLSEATDNKERYNMLHKLGADDRMIRQAVFKQVFFYFALPLLVALVHAVVGIAVCVDTVLLFGQLDILSTVILTAVLILIVYGGYFLATAWRSKKIATEFH